MIKSTAIIAVNIKRVVDATLKEISFLNDVTKVKLFYVRNSFQQYSYDGIF